MISTHKMLAGAGIKNTAQITDRASTQSKNTIHFFAMEESHPVTVVTDDIGGALKIDNATSNVTVTDGGPGVGSVRILARPETNTITGGNWIDPGTNDYLLLIMGQSVDGGGGADDNGSLSFYFGINTHGQMILHPYYSAFYDGDLIATNAATLVRLTTPTVQKYLNRTAGQDYMFLSLKRGDYLEHYAKSTGLAEYTGNRLIAGSLLDSVWANQTGRGNEFQTGHSGYGAQNTCTAEQAEAEVLCTIEGEPIPGSFTGTTNQAQDIYGLMQHIFLNGAPSRQEIINGMDWMFPHWLVNEKVIYPGWMF